MTNFNLLLNSIKSIHLQLQDTAAKAVNKLLTISDPLKRTFYEVEAIKGNWSGRELKRQFNSLSFERMGLSQDKKSSLA